MGVNAEHPLFAVGEGWLTAGELAPDDEVRNAELQALTVLAVELDPTPQLVHNLEVGSAHTYFAGELEVWSHNGLGAYVLRFTRGTYVGQGCTVE